MSVELEVGTRIVEAAILGGVWGVAKFGFTRVDPTKAQKEKLDVMRLARTLVFAAIVGLLVGLTGVTAPAAGLQIEPYVPLVVVVVDLAQVHVTKWRASRGTVKALG